MIDAFSQASQRDIPYEVVPRRVGDIATSRADPTKANTVLHWAAELGLNEMCASSWKWQVGNPNGYSSKGQINEL